MNKLMQDIIKNITGWINERKIKCIINNWMNEWMNDWMIA